MFAPPGSVVVLPATAWSEHEQVLERLSHAFPNRNIVVIESGESVPHMCAALARVPLTSPVSLLAYGSSSLALPAVALALRARHVDIHTYVLIDPDVPAPSDSWPECPVTAVFSSEGKEATRTRLYGWTVVVSERPIEAAVAALDVS